MFHFAFFFFLSLPALAGVIATVETLDPTCGSTVTESGEFTVSASQTCAGSSASASAVFPAPGGEYQLRVAGSKAADVPSISATAEFRDWLLVTGTETSGFLRLYVSWASLYLTTLSPSRIQGSYFYLNGEAYPDGPFGAGGMVYVPFQAGVPVLIEGLLYGFAGARDTFRRGEFDATVRLGMTGLSQFAVGPDENPMYINGASLVRLPEPSTIMLMAVGVLALMWWRWREYTGDALQFNPSSGGTLGNRTPFFPAAGGTDSSRRSPDFDS